MSEVRTADHRTRHWTGVGAIALLLTGLGVLVREPGLVLSGGLGIVFAGYAGLARPPAVGGEGDVDDAIEIRRAVDDTAPEPGDEVRVTVEVSNAGDGFLPDVRVTDGVPEPLAVVDGSPRHATALGPGGSNTFEYTVTASRGDHVWQPAHVIAADPSGSIERETSVDAETTLRCTPALLSTGDLPLRGLTTPYAGRVETNDGGAGVEFFSSRDYRPGDPMKRIDWHRLAKEGELGTLQFTEERSATVVLLVDARRAAYRAPEPTAPHAVERSVTATARIFAALLQGGDRVGIAVFGAREAWLRPGMGREHRTQGRELLSTHPSLSPVPPSDRLFESFREDRQEELKERRIRRLEKRLSDDAQVFVFSPCCDDFIPRVARRLDAHGHATTVVSPDPTADDSPGRRLAGMERADRLRWLRRRNVRVVDWDRDDPLSVALKRASARWTG